jgi:hypothetical protein
MKTSQNNSFLLPAYTPDVQSIYFPILDVSILMVTFIQFHSNLLFPKAFNFFCSNSGAFEVNSPLPKGCFDIDISYGMNLLLSLTSNRTFIEIVSEKSQIFLFLANEFENSFLRVATDHSLQSGISYFSIPPLHQLPYTYSQFSFLDDFVLIFPNFEIHFNRFLLSCISDEINENVLKNEKSNEFTIALSGSDQMDISAKELEFVLKGRTLEITKDNLDDLVELSKRLKIPSLIEACFQFQHQIKQN